jgi:hypothetical protein
VEEEPAGVRMKAVVPAIAEAVHGNTNSVSILLVDTRDTLAAAVRGVETSLRDQVAELRSTVASQHRRRPEALLLVPPDAVKPEFLAAENLRRLEPEEGIQSSTAVGQRPRCRLNLFRLCCCCRSPSLRLVTRAHRGVGAVSDGRYYGSGSMG